MILFLFSVKHYNYSAKTKKIASVITTTLFLLDTRECIVMDMYTKSFNTDIKATSFFL